MDMAVSKAALVMTDYVLALLIGLPLGCCIIIIGYNLMRLLGWLLIELIEYAERRERRRRRP